MSLIQACGDCLKNINTMLDWSGPGLIMLIHHIPINNLVFYLNQLAINLRNVCHVNVYDQKLEL